LFGIFEMSRWSLHLIRFGYGILSLEYVNHAVFAFDSGHNVFRVI
jgi:hypothetical protein